jgi:hypothetical protein
MDPFPSWIYLEATVSQFFSLLWQIPERNNLKEVKFILDMVSKVPVHDRLAPWLWSCGETEHHGDRRAWQSKLFTSWHLGSRDTDRKQPGQDISFKDMLPVTYFLQPELASLLTPDEVCALMIQLSVHSTTSLGPSLQHMSLLSDTLYLNHNRVWQC